MKRYIHIKNIVIDDILDNTINREMEYLIPLTDIISINFYADEAESYVMDTALKDNIDLANIWVMDCLKADMEYWTKKTYSADVGGQIEEQLASYTVLNTVKKGDPTIVKDFLHIRHDIVGGDSGVCSFYLFGTPQDIAVEKVDNHYDLTFETNKVEHKLHFNHKNHAIEALNKIKAL
jgi:hypothetical protein